MEIALALNKKNMAGNAAERPQKELDFVIHAAVIPHCGPGIPIGAAMLNSLLSRD